MEIKLNIPIHSITLVIGAGLSGKTNIAKEHIVPALQKNARPGRVTNVQFVSLEDIKRSMGQMHEDDFHNRSPEMKEISNIAHSVLTQRVDALSKYPLNAEFIVVDADDMSEMFIDGMKLIAKKNNYRLGVIVLDFNKKEEFFKNIPKGESKEEQKLYSNFINEDFVILKDEFIPSLKKGGFKFIHRIHNRDFRNLCFECKDFVKFSSNLLNPSIEYTMIGDVHGCFDEMIELIKLNGFEIYKSGIIKEDITRILISCGDLVDKGSKIKETIEFAHKNVKKGRMKMVIGNHENFVYKYLKGVITKTKVLTEAQQKKKDDKRKVKEEKLKKENKKVPDHFEMIIDDEFLNKFMNSIFILEEDESLREKFFELVDMSNEFYIHRDFVLTHAPCKDRYIGKVDGGSLSKQRSVVYPKRRDYKSDEEYVVAVGETLKVLSSGEKMHIHGHIQTAEVMEYGNKINLDTGCVAGGKLTSLTIGRNKEKTFNSVDSKQENPTGELFRFLDS